MLIVDSQVHIWGADTPDRPWPPGGAQRAQKPYPVTKDMLLAEMDTAGVSRVVIVPPSWEGDRNDLGLAAARLHPKRFAVMGRLAIERPESRALVAHWKKQPGMLGMRLGGPSGARISRGCRAPIASASTCSPKNCPGSRATTSSGS
jgi:predicted TIM-barrel fold metal-dependent hydrolase